MGQQEKAAKVASSWYFDCSFFGIALAPTVVAMRGLSARLIWISSAIITLVALSTRASALPCRTLVEGAAAVTRLKETYTHPEAQAYLANNALIDRLLNLGFAADVAHMVFTIASPPTRVEIAEIDDQQENSLSSLSSERYAAFTVVLDDHDQPVYRIRLYRYPVSAP